MLTQAEHWRYFADFCLWEKDCGGPDPQLAMVNAMSLRCSREEQVWRAGVYISVYNVPYAEAIWRYWSWKRVTAATEGEILAWLQEHWSKITTRIERRCVRRPEWLARFLVGYREFADAYPRLVGRLEKLPRADRYDAAWEVALAGPFLGRYVALKLLEYLRRYCGLFVTTPDMRPKDGWSPRRQLALLWDEPGIDRKDNDPKLLARINELVLLTQKKLEDDYSIRIDLFQLQVMLCEFRESWEGERQYPGRSIDSELKYAYKAEKDWGYKSDIWAARKALFREWSLGELNGWDGPRENCATVLAHYGYTWSDAKYIYAETTDFADPMCREGYRRPKIRQFSAPAAPKKARVKRKRSPLTLWPVIPGKLYQSERWVHHDEEVVRAAVEEHGITGVACFWKDDPRIRQFVDWYQLWPLKDGQGVPDEVHMIADVMADYIRGGGVLVSQCYGGRNRSGLLSALTAQRVLGCSPREGLAAVKNARKGALTNPHFVAYLTRARRVEVLF